EAIEGAGAIGEDAWERLNSMAGNLKGTYGFGAIAKSGVTFEDFEKALSEETGKVKAAEAAHQKELDELARKQKEAEDAAARSSQWGRNVGLHGRENENIPDVVSGEDDDKKKKQAGGGGGPSRRRVSGLSSNLGVVV